MRPRVLCVDDDPSILAGHQRNLRSEFDVDVACGGYEGLEAIAAAGPYAVVLADMQMPGMNGVEFLAHVRECAPATARIMLMGHGNLDVAMQAVNQGNVLRFLTKPCPPGELVDVLHQGATKYQEESDARDAHVQLEGRVLQLESDVMAAQIATVFATAKLAESRDPYTGNHLRRIPKYCDALARSLAEVPGAPDGIDDRFIDTLQLASLLHDIGKVGIRDEILMKPGRLTAEERKVMETHTVIGARVLEIADNKFPGNEAVTMGVDVARSHHERWDGNGYPRGLSGADLPLSARIVALADAYDALISKRPYKAPVSHEAARSIIESDSGTAFDPEIVDAFRATQEHFRRLWQLTGARSGHSRSICAPTASIADAREVARGALGT